MKESTDVIYLIVAFLDLSIVILVISTLCWTYRNWNKDV